MRKMGAFNFFLAFLLIKVEWLKWIRVYGYESDRVRKVKPRHRGGKPNRKKQTNWKPKRIDQHYKSFYVNFFVCPWPFSKTREGLFDLEIWRGETDEYGRR